MKLVNIDEAVNYLKKVVTSNSQLVDILCALNEMPEYDHWNSCEDCMPEDDPDYKNRKAIKVLATTKGKKVVKIQRTRRDLNENWHWTGNFNVVAWMYLPKYYVKEDE